jgi:hypothetical protein
VPALLFGAAIPLRGMVGDQQAALVGQACFSPDKPFDELLRIAFKGRVIEDTTHMMFKKLRGLV